ncbi:abortive infection family protein [Bradyrhizobium sp. AZCC 1578]|uniref:abortive infection family protein n=1 Tax=Bradyrhizobium sp. AZCC 1578 TaxID=3117027 RepID=UPI002FEED2F1
MAPFKEVRAVKRLRTSVVEGLGSLRNKIGDAHGQGGKPVRPSARHAAQLAVNLAGAMATFLDTWIVRNT